MNTDLLAEKSPLPPPAPHRKKWRLIILCLSFLVCGIFIGGILAQTILFHHRPGHGNLEERTNAVVSHMRRNYDLTEEQAKQIYTIVKERFTALSNAMRTTFDGMDSEIRAVLNNEQIVKFDKEMAERRRKSFDNPKEDKK
ncbi:MAG: hypothetical protein HY811_10290 [Planctomycetes bacterium]|nr:hypothetical protein [Planctomycetota bacterium]